MVVLLDHRVLDKVDNVIPTLDLPGSIVVGRLWLELTPVSGQLLHKVLGGVVEADEHAVDKERKGQVLTKVLLTCRNRFRRS